MFALVRHYVADLKLELKQRGLPTTGNKTELAERLQLVMQDNSLSLDETNEDIIDEDAVLADEEIEEEAEVDGDKVDADGDIEDDVDEEVEEEVEKEAEALLSSTEENSSTGKKIILNRKPIIEEVKVDAVAKDEDEKLAGDGAPEKKIIKLSELDAKERLEMRAKKFGVPLSDSAKKEARSARFNANNISTNNGNSKSADSIKTPVHTTYDTLKKRAERFGTNVSTLMDKAEQEDRILKRKARFGEIKPIDKVIPTKIKIVK